MQVSSFDGCACGETGLAGIANRGTIGGEVFMLTAKQAADELGISRQRVNVLIKSGRIKAHKLGENTSGYVITRDALDKYKAQQD